MEGEGQDLSGGEKRHGRVLVLRDGVLVAMDDVQESAREELESYSGPSREHVERHELSEPVVRERITFGPSEMTQARRQEILAQVQAKSSKSERQLRREQKVEAKRADRYHAALFDTSRQSRTYVFDREDEARTAVDALAAFELASHPVTEPFDSGFIVTVPWTRNLPPFRLNKVMARHGGTQSSHKKQDILLAHALEWFEMRAESGASR